jgi:MFS family permease
MLIVWLLYFARLIQGIAGIVVWVVGFAVLTDTVGTANMGKTLGFVSIFMNSASFSGPMAGGVLLETIGYYPTWAVPIAVVSFFLILCRVLTNLRYCYPFSL